MCNNNNNENDNTVKKRISYKIVRKYFFLKHSPHTLHFLYTMQSSR